MKFVIKKAKNIQLENYRDYMFKKYERFDYSAKDCYELAESIRKYVVPLKDKILLEKRETASGYASPVGCISCNSRSKST